MRSLYLRLAKLLFHCIVFCLQGAAVPDLSLQGVARPQAVGLQMQHSNISEVLRCHWE